MRTSTFIVSLGMALLLVGCNFLDSERQPVNPHSKVSAAPQTAPDPHPVQPNGEISATPTAVLETAAAQPNGEVSTDLPVVSDPHPAEPDDKVSVSPTTVLQTAPIQPNRRVSVAPLPYEGPTSLEERTLTSPVIARVRLDSVSTSTESGQTYMGMKYKALLEFNFSVLEYLKGSGDDDIVALWQAAPFFDTSQEAEEALTTIAAARDDRWDDQEAIVFLQLSSASLASTQRAGRYFLAWGGGWSHYVPDDGYSIASRHDRLWLPADKRVRCRSPAVTSSASSWTCHRQQGQLRRSRWAS